MEDIISYWKRITRLTPSKEQVQILENLADINIKNLALCCGRGFSKTMLSALACLWFADVYSTETKQPLEILLVSAQQRIYWHLNNFFHDNKNLVNRLSQRGMFREIPIEGFQFEDTRSIVDTALATSGSIRSHRADIIFVDEACLVKNEVFYKDILPVSSGSISKVVILSTPSTDNFFTDICSNPNKHGYKLLQFSAELCPWQEESNKRLKKSLSKQEYASEVLGRVPTQQERSFFNSIKVSRAFQDISNTPERTFDSKILCGIDLGYGLPCCTVITIIEKKKSKCKLITQIRMKGLDLQTIIKVLNEYSPRMIKVDSKPQELVRLLKEGLDQYRNRIKVIDATTRKKQMLTQLQALINSGNLVIPQENNLDLKLEFNRYHLHKRSGDDRIDSLALAVFESPEIEIETPRIVMFTKDKFDIGA